jgi:uncharacterized membrane protein YfhO
MRRAFVVGTAPILEKCEGDIVSLASRDVNRLTLDADMRCRGMVNVSETYFPGWRATVDGRTAPIHETYGVLRGVVVDAGRHRIEMVYRPATVIWGGILTAVGLAGMAIAAKFLRA